MSASKVRVILGTMEMGRRLNEEQSVAVLEKFFQAGYTELDTALMYCKGETEKILGRMSIFHSPPVSKYVATKVNPWGPERLKHDSVIQQLTTSLASLQLAQVDLLYLHAPDHETPLEETLAACNLLHKQGKFKELGLSNYSAELVRKVVALCAQNGWVKPTVYQGMYNAITRDVERDLFPVLRELGLRMYIYNPLAGGLLTGKYKFEDLENQPLGRFFGNDWADRYRERYWKRDNFDALERIKAALARIYPDGSVNLTSASLLWTLHHSKLDGELGDGVILGASTVGQLEENVRACKQGPLHPEVVKEFDAAWESVKGLCPAYYR